MLVTIYLCNYKLENECIHACFWSLFLENIVQSESSMISLQSLNSIVASSMISVRKSLLCGIAFTLELFHTIFISLHIMLQISVQGCTMHSLLFCIYKWLPDLS